MQFVGGLSKVFEFKHSPKIIEKFYVQYISWILKIKSIILIFDDHGKPIAHNIYEIKY